MAVSTRFEARPEYAFGRMGESAIARWLRYTQGCNVLPVYEKEIEDGKGPRFYTTRGEIVAPDMLGMKGGKVFWIEAKRKDVFSWYWKGGYWVTGIDLNHYHAYRRLAEGFPHPIWLLFLHEHDRATRKRASEPWPCPTGLFGGSIERLAACESHRSWKHGRSGMVYWAHHNLRRLATLEEVYAAGEDA